MPELTFVHPERWWWLLLLPLLLLLLLPPRPRRVHWTAHLPQWRLALQGLKRKPPRALSPRTVLLLLAAGCAALATMGLARRGEPGPTRLAVLLDASSSMAAVSDGETAFARARTQLGTTLAALPPHVEVSLLRCGDPVVRRHGPSARQLHDLGGVGGAQPFEFAALAAQVAAEQVVPWTLTDGQGQRALPAVGALSLFGERARNAAVLTVRIVDHWPLPELELETSVVAFGGAEHGPLSGTVSVAGGVVAVPPLSVSLRSGQAQTLSWSLQRTAVGGELAVGITIAGDALPADDHWRALLPPLPAPRIAVLQGDEAGPFAHVAAAALAAEVGGEVVAPTAGVEVGLLLVDGGEVAITPGATRALCFGSRYRGSGEPLPWPRTGAIDWDHTAPLTAGLDLSELRVDQVFADTIPDGGQPFLFASPRGARQPLGVVVGDEELASVHFGFRLRDSNLPLLAAFPQLLRRAFVRCYGSAAQIVATSPPPAIGEQDLWRRAVGQDRPLPAFGTPDESLGRWLLLVGLMLLAVRAWLR